MAFSFNMVKPAQVAYQIVYQQEGRWNFDEARLIYDDAERYGVYGDTPGYLSPGMKQRSLTLSRAETGSFGYVLVQLITQSGGTPSLASSRVLCAPPESGDPELAIRAGGAFIPSEGEEMGFIISHVYPCEMTVIIKDEAGKTVRRLASRTPTRPEQLSPRGSSFCWNGRRNNGDMAEPGQYRVHVKAYVGEDVYEAESDWFALAAE